MSRRAVPFIVAGVTGVLSGIYIFKPLFDQNNTMATSDDVPSPAASPTAARSGLVDTTSQGDRSPTATAGKPNATVKASSER
ncbi:hypothetical protein BV20DRAFT_960631 [Pilatotrama ljubarskyi]|nr:hypothetical protein BV20DRAFT_960631 [Pilatotrama ljubarskyi]